MATKKKGSMKGHTIKGGHKRPTKSGAGMTKKGVANTVETIPALSCKQQLRARLRKVVRTQRGVSRSVLVLQGR